MYQCMWHLLIMLPAQFSETARGKGEAILEAGSFSSLSESLGVWQHSLSSKVLFCFSSWNGRKTTPFFLSFVCFVVYFGRSSHVGFFHWCLYIACSMLRKWSLYIGKYCHEHKFSTKFSNGNLPLLLINITYIWLLFAKNFLSLL